MKRRYAKGLSLQNVLIVGAGEMGKAVGQKLVQYEGLGFVVKGFLDDEKKQGEEIDINGGVKILGPIQDLRRILEKDNISDVFIALDLNNYPKILETFKILDKFVVNVTAFHLKSEYPGFRRFSGHQYRRTTVPRDNEICQESYGYNCICVSPCFALPFNTCYWSLNQIGLERASVLQAGKSWTGWKKVYSV
jgi:hypothetical protein